MDQESDPWHMTYSHVVSSVCECLRLPKLIGASRVSACFCGAPLHCTNKPALGSPNLVRQVCCCNVLLRWRADDVRDFVPLAAFFHLLFLVGVTSGPWTVFLDRSGALSHSEWVEINRLRCARLEANHTVQPPNWSPDRDVQSCLHGRLCRHLSLVRVVCSGLAGVTCCGVPWRCLGNDTFWKTEVLGFWYLLLLRLICLCSAQPMHSLLL